MPKGPRGEKRPADVIGAARGWGKPAQAVQIKGDPDSPVIFNLRLGDGMVEGGAVEVLASEALTAPLVAFSGSDDADSPV